MRPDGRLTAATFLTALTVLTRLTVLTADRCQRNSQTALRRVGPLYPPALCSPSQSPGGEREPSGGARSYYPIKMIRLCCAVYSLCPTLALVG